MYGESETEKEERKERERERKDCNLNFCASFVSKKNMENFIDL